MGQWDSESSFSHPDEADLLAEAKLLRQHKGRLEARMHILEEHNKQLESQLHRLRQLLHQVTPLLQSEDGGLRRGGHVFMVAQYRNNQGQGTFVVVVEIDGCLAVAEEVCLNRFPDCHADESTCRAKDEFCFHTPTE